LIQTLSPEQYADKAFIGKYRDLINRTFSALLPEVISYDAGLGLADKVVELETQLTLVTPTLEQRLSSTTVCTLFIPPVESRQTS
jgi:hypothetical protein